MAKKFLTADYMDKPNRGAYAGSLWLELTGPEQMDGRTVILRAARRIPGAIEEVLSRQSVNVEHLRGFVIQPHESDAIRLALRS